MKKNFRNIFMLLVLIGGLGYVSKGQHTTNLGLAVVKKVFQSENEYAKTAGTAIGGGAGAVAGAWAGTKAGAAIGMIGGPAGAAIGGVLGGTAGAL